MKVPKLILLIFLLSFSKNCLAQNIDYKKFEGSKVKINNSSQLSEPYWLDYNSLEGKVIDTIIINPISSNIAEKVISDKYASLLNNENGSNYIRLYQKLTFSFKADQLSIIGYRTSVNGVNSNYQDIIVAKDQTNQWNEIKNSEVKELSYIVRNINSNMFWEFYNNEDNPDYPEINQLKPSVKDANGVLNIKKLAQVLNDNKSQLQKYLDE